MDLKELSSWRVIILFLMDPLDPAVDPTVQLRVILDDPSVDVNMPILEGCSIIHFVAQGNKHEGLQLLLASDRIDPNVVNPTNGWNVLHYAVSTGDEKIVEIVLNDKRIDVNVNLGEGTPVQEAIRRMKDAEFEVEDMPVAENIFRQLIEDPRVDLCIKSLATNVEPLLGACALGVPKAVSMLLEKPEVDPSTHIVDGLNPLHVASLEENEEILAILLRDGRVDPSIEFPTGGNILHSAAEEGFAEVIQLLLQDSRVDPTILDRTFNSNALHFAATNGKTEVAKLLLEDGRIDVNLKDTAENSLPPLSLFCVYGQIELVEIALKSDKVDVNAADQFGRTPLHIAMWKQHEGIINLLLNHKNIQNPFKDKSKPKLPDDSFLRDPELDVNKMNNNNETLLYQAAARNDAEIVQFLIEHPDIDPNICPDDETFPPPLHAAAQESNLEILQILLSHKDIDVNKKDPKTDTAVIITACVFYTPEKGEIVEALLEHPTFVMPDSIVNGVMASEYPEELGFLICSVLLIPPEEIFTSYVEKGIPLEGEEPGDRENMLDEIEVIINNIKNRISKHRSKGARAPLPAAKKARTD